MSNVEITKAREAAMRAGRKTYPAITACTRGHLGFRTVEGDECVDCARGEGARPIIRYSDALDAGYVRYFTGKPCRNGHVAERFTSNGACVTCSGIAARNTLRDNRRALIGLGPTKVKVSCHRDDAWAVTGFVNGILGPCREAGRPFPPDMMTRLGEALKAGTLFGMHPDLASLHPQDQEALASTARDLTALRALSAPVVPPAPVPSPTVDAPNYELEETPESRRTWNGQLEWNRVYTGLLGRNVHPVEAAKQANSHRKQWLADNPLPEDAPVLVIPPVPPIPTSRLHPNVIFERRQMAMEREILKQAHADNPYANYRLDDDED